MLDRVLTFLTAFEYVGGALGTSADERENYNYLSYGHI